jgi:hypothetical protein
MDKHHGKPLPINNKHITLTTMKQLFTLLLLVPIGMQAQQNCATAVTAVPGTVYDVSFAPGSQVPAPICTEGQNNPDNLNHGAW